MGQPGTKVNRLNEQDYSHKAIVSSHGQVMYETPEQRYSKDVPLSRRRKLGQFFTPESIARLMASWILEKEPTTIIDPSVGCGVFPRVIGELYNRNPRMDCYDIDPTILSYLENQLNIISKIKVCDFLKEDIKELYDAVIMNPPYLRHHDMMFSESIHEKISCLEDHFVPKTANAYVLFVMKACNLLRRGGRGAFIIPTEWSNANFGSSFKEYLINKAGLREVIYFSNCSNVFEDALTTACILFVEKDGRIQDKIPVTYVQAATQSRAFSNLADIKKTHESREIESSTLLSSTKWDYLIKHGKQKEIRGFTKLGNIVKSKRGIATGANSFFHLSYSDIKDIGINPQNVLPCIGKASDIKGLLFSDADLSRLIEAGKKTALISMRVKLNEAEERYILKGEALGINERYLLSKRRPWFSMEERSPAPIWAAVFGREELRFIYNEARAYNLTTFHGIYPNRQDKIFVRALTVALNSQLVQERARAHIRVYGGGLLKFEPKDILEIEIPNLEVLSKETLYQISKCLPDSSAQEIDQKLVNKLIHQAAEEASRRTLQSSEASPPTGLT